MVQTAVSKTVVPCSSQGGPAKYTKKMNIFRNIVTELKKTKWPTWKQIGILTIYTLIICGIITLLILGLDLGLYKIRDWFLNV